MKKTFLLAACAVAVTCSLAARELIYNPGLNADGRSFPSGWMPLTHSGAQVLYFRDGGPDNKPFFRLTSRKAASRLHQTNLKSKPRKSPLKRPPRAEISYQGRR